MKHPHTHALGIRMLALGTATLAATFVFLPLAHFTSKHAASMLPVAGENPPGPGSEQPDPGMPPSPNGASNTPVIAPDTLFSCDDHEPRHIDVETKGTATCNLTSQAYTFRPINDWILDPTNVSAQEMASCAKAAEADLRTNAWNAAEQELSALENEAEQEAEGLTQYCWPVPSDGPPGFTVEVTNFSVSAQSGLVTMRFLWPMRTMPAYMFGLSTGNATLPIHWEARARI